jgi:hypothetical protein
MTTNPNEQATDAVNRTAQELLAALLAKDIRPTRSSRSVASIPTDS